MSKVIDPALSTFTALDPFEGLVQRPMSLNGYSWVEGNPVMNTDPGGMFNWQTHNTEYGDCLYCIGRELGLAESELAQFAEDVAGANPGDWYGDFRLHINRSLYFQWPWNQRSINNPPFAGLHCPGDCLPGTPVPPTPTPTDTPAPPTPTPLPTITPTPTLTPTSTPSITPTPLPTNTPAPTCTPTLTPSPTLSPSGRCFEECMIRTGGFEIFNSICYRHCTVRECTTPSEVADSIRALIGLTPLDELANARDYAICTSNIGQAVISYFINVSTAEDAAQRIVTGCAAVASESAGQVLDITTLLRNIGDPCNVIIPEGGF